MYYGYEAECMSLRAWSYLLREYLLILLPKGYGNIFLAIRPIKVIVMPFVTLLVTCFVSEVLMDKTAVLFIVRSILMTSQGALYKTYYELVKSR